MIDYETMSGGRLELPDPTPALAVFLGRLRDALADEDLSLAAFTTLAYGVQNPLLDTTSSPGRAIVTAEVHASPYYHALADMLVRKQTQQDSRRFTMKVIEAAAALGYSEGAVRQAIAGGRLAARKVGGVYLVDRDAVAAYDTSKRRGPVTGAKATATAEVTALEVRAGSRPGASFRIKGALIEGTKDGSVRTGTVRGWTGLAVLSSVKEKGARYWELAPDASAEPAELAFHEFYVRGRFRIVDKSNN